MSAPMPPVLQSGAPGQVVYQHKATLDELMTPRRLHIPTFYVGHTDLSAVVCAKGEPLLAELSGRPFTVGEIPVERRWAVSQYDRGRDRLVPGTNLMEEPDFKMLYERWRLEFYSLVAEDRKIGAIKYDGNINAEPIPNIRAFVSVQIDPQDDTKVQDMHYRNATAGAVPEVVYDAKGENPRARDEVLMEAYRVSPGRLTAKELAYVEESLLAEDDPMKGLSALNARLVSGDITPQEFAAKAAEIAGASSVPKVGKRKGYTTARCGADVANFQKRKHEAECPDCQKGE